MARIPPKEADFAVLQAGCFVFVFFVLVFGRGSADGTRLPSHEGSTLNAKIMNNSFLELRSNVVMFCVAASAASIHSLRNPWWFQRWRYAGATAAIARPPRGTALNRFFAAHCKVFAPSISLERERERDSVPLSRHRPSREEMGGGCASVTACFECVPRPRPLDCCTCYAVLEIFWVFFCRERKAD